MRLLQCMVGTAVLVGAVVAGAQEEGGVNVFGYTGYGFAIGGRYVGTSDEGNAGNEKDHYLNQGRGIKLGLGAGYRAMENMDVQLALHFSGGIPRVTPDIAATDDQGGVQENTYKTSQFGIHLLAVPQFSLLDLADAYVGTGAGLVFNFSSRDVARTTTTQGTFEATVKHVNTPSVALLGLAGVNYPLQETMDLFAEIAFEAANTTRREDEVTSSNFPTNLNSSLEEGQAVIYEKDAVNATHPLRTPASNIAIRIGVRLYVL